MLAALREAGWRNYSLFLREDGLLVGYLETDDFEAAQAAMAAPRSTPAGRRRWRRSSRPRRPRPTRAGRRSTEVFHLDATLEIGDMTDMQVEGSALRAQRIETPSWAYGNSGTRFKVFAQQGVPRDPYEKLADAAQVHRFTGVAPTRRAAHPVGPGRRLRRPGRARRGAGRRHRRDQRQRLPGRRLHARQRHQPRPAGARARRSTTCSSASTSWTRTGSRDLKLWFSDGTNYPGQDDIRARQDRLAEALARGVRPARRRPAVPAGVQAVRAGLLHHRRARLGHRRTRTA